MSKIKVGEVFFPNPINTVFLARTLEVILADDWYSHNEFEKQITPSTNGIRLTIWEDDKDEQV